MMMIMMVDDDGDHKVDGDDDRFSPTNPTLPDDHDLDALLSF